MLQLLYGVVLWHSWPIKSCVQVRTFTADTPHASVMFCNSSAFDEIQFCACFGRSQQKAAGQKTSSPKQQAGTSPFGQSAQGSAPSAPTPSQVAASDSGPGRTGAPDGHPQLALTSAGSQPPGSMHAGPPNMQELQQNLLRPATHPAARLQAAADPGAAQGQS